MKYLAGEMNAMLLQFRHSSQALILVVVFTLGNTTIKRCSYFVRLNIHLATTFKFELSFAIIKLHTFNGVLLFLICILALQGSRDTYSFW